MFFSPQVCLVMEYAEGGSLYNGKSTFCIKNNPVKFPMLNFANN